MRIITGTLLIGTLCASPAFAGTLKGALTYKADDGSLVVKKGEITLDANAIEKIHMKLGEAEAAGKGKAWKLETENRTLIIAAFRDVGDLPEGKALIIKGSLIEGTNAKMLSGDVFVRSCAKGFAAEKSDEDQSLARMIVQARERKGCETDYRGNFVLVAQPDDTQQQDQAQDQGQGQQDQGQGEQAQGEQSQGG